MPALLKYCIIRLNHVTHGKQRGRIWHIHPYPCIGMWGFLKPTLKWSEINGEYNQVVRRIKHGDKFLDVGCAMGQDLRWLAADGVPTENLFAAGNA